MKYTLVYILSLLSFSVMAMPNADEAQIKAALRRAGHQILLEAGDSSSKVLPITRVDDHYELRFEDEFTFDPGILASIIDTELERSKLANEYVLEVYDCLQEEVVYSYEVLFTEKDDIIACSGRLQEKGCYVIYLELKQLPPLPMPKASKIPNTDPEAPIVGVLSNSTA